MNRTTPADEEAVALLRRVLAAVEGDRRKQWAEVASAFLLALATVGSAWCAYQSSLWGGVQTFRLAEAGKAGRGATQQALAALQYRAADAHMATAYFEAKARGDEKLAAFLLARFRPDARGAFDAWLKADPFNDPAAPLRPFELAEYRQPEAREAARLDAEAARLLDAAQAANETSDTYVLLTVLFASVLFFGGIAGTLQSRRLRGAVVVLAALLFLGTVAVLATMPVCRE